MKVIALFGKGGIGKTTTLNLLNNLINPDPPATNLRKDDKYTFTYKGKTISITTPGDNAKEINNNNNYAKEKKCDIWVTASRTKGQSVKKLEEISKNIRWIEKNVGHKRQDLVNEAQAADLQAIIDDVINQLNAKEVSASPTP